MKTSILVASFAALQTLSPIALADKGNSCHFHGKTPASEAVVTDCATQRRDALVKAGKLELVEGKKGKEWKASFLNAASAHPSKQTLYVVFSHPGNFIAANFTGQ